MQQKFKNKKGITIEYIANKLTKQEYDDEHIKHKMTDGNRYYEITEEGKRHYFENRLKPSTKIIKAIFWPATIVISIIGQKYFKQQ